MPRSGVAEKMMASLALETPASGAAGGAHDYEGRPHTRRAMKLEGVKEVCNEY
jgi:hypothetical protein